MSLTRSISNHLKAAAISGLLIAPAMQPAHAYHLRGAICKHGGNPSISLENQDGKFIVELATGAGGKSQVDRSQQTHTPRTNEAELIRDRAAELDRHMTSGGRIPMNWRAAEDST